MGKTLLRKEKQVEKYPGVEFNEYAKRWTATHMTNGYVKVATCDTFEQAKTAMEKFEKA